jgi:hypothetical protein
VLSAGLLRLYGGMNPRWLCLRPPEQHDDAQRHADGDESARGRLVLVSGAPILDASNAWFDQHPEPLRAELSVWQQSGEDAALPLSGKPLQRASRSDQVGSSTFNPLIRLKVKASVPSNSRAGGVPETRPTGSTSKHGIRVLTRLSHAC